MNEPSKNDPLRHEPIKDESHKDESIRVELLLEQRDFKKLVELAGGEAGIAGYVGKVVRRMYAYHTAFGGDLNLEKMLETAQALERKNEAYEAEVVELQRHIKQLTMTQRELRATVAFLRSAMLDLGNNSAQRGLH